MAHVQIKIWRANSRPTDEGILIDADLTPTQEGKVNTVLTAAFERNIIDDFGIEPVSGIVSFEDALARITKILGEKEIGRQLAER